jgi:prophage DNA circulation protein
MSWRENLFFGTLDGVPFKWRSVSTRVGWRNVVHEFYGDRPPFVESIGPSPWRTTIDIYLIGDNYLVTKNRLLNTLQRPGPWEFVHPTMGPIQVKLEQPAELTESVSELGMVRIGQLSLVEAGLASPAIFDATQRKLANLAAEVADVMARSTRLGLLGAIDKVLDSITGAINKATGRLAKVNNRIGAITGDMASIQSAINNFSQQRSLLQQSPFMIIGGLVGIGMAAFNALGRYKIPRRTVTVEEPTWGTLAVGSAAIRDLATFETEPDEAALGVPEGPQLELAVEAHHEIQLQMQTLAYVAGASIAGDLPYASAVEAAAMMTTLEQGMAATMADPGLPVLALEALAELRTTTIRHLLERKAELPQVVKVSPPATMPALVLAYELYGDAARATELCARNKVRRPGFVVEGTELEVLVDA